MIITDLAPVAGPGLDDFSFPEDTALIVVGDVHGRARTLRALAHDIAALDTGTRKRHVVFLGDAIDKGPASVECLEIFWHEFAALTRADEFTYLPGNHELLLADALDEARGGMVRTSATTLWLRNGGLKVLLEVFPSGPVHDVLKPFDEDMDRCFNPDEERYILAPLMPRMTDITRMFVAELRERGIDLLGWIRSMPSHLRVGDALCVHAGLNDRVSLETCLSVPQEEHLVGRYHWSWIREEFLGRQGGWFETREELGSKTGGLLVLHGHTVPKRWHPKPRYRRALSDPARIEEVFCRMATSARVCVDFGAGQGLGLGGCLLTSEGRRLFFREVDLDHE